MHRLITVIGGNSASDKDAEFAHALGGLLAAAGFSVVCGGGGGVMEAACMGCSENGGLTVGILPGEETSEANPFVKVALPTGIGTSRNRQVVLAGKAVCAVGGAYGTLSEIAFALQAGKPVCCFGSWESIPGVRKVSTPGEAMEFVLEMIGDN